MLSVFRKILQSKRGSILVLAAGAMTVLIGISALAIDAGFLYLNKAELQTSVDSGALAGAQELPFGGASTATSVAGNYAGVNGKAGDVIQVSINNNTQVSVSATRTVPLFFANLFGVSQGDVRAAATAAIYPLSSFSGVVPFGLETQTLAYGSILPLKKDRGMVIVEIMEH